MQYMFILLFTLISMSSSKNSFGQGTANFAPIGAEWWHDDEPNGFVARIHAQVIGDTIIQQQVVRKIIQTRYNKTWLSGNTYIIDTFIARPLFIYDTQDTVFIFNENFNRFTALFVFNVHEGDTVCLPVVPDIYNQSDLLSNPMANGDTSFCFIIDSIRTVLYDTTYLETFFEHVTTSFPPAYNWEIPDEGYSGGYARKIGGLSYGLLPTKLYGFPVRPTQDTLGFSSLIGGFKCYEEDSLQIHIPRNNDLGCYFTPTLNIQETHDLYGLLHIFPNPTKGEIHINSEIPIPDKICLTITDVLGRLLQEHELSKGTTNFNIHLDGLAPGIYFMNIYSKNERYFHKVILTR